MPPTPSRQPPKGDFSADSCTTLAHLSDTNFLLVAHNELLNVTNEQTDKRWECGVGVISPHAPPHFSPMIGLHEMEFDLGATAL